MKPEDVLRHEVHEIVEQEAMRFGLPSEFIAGLLAAEVMYDTDFINTIYDVVTIGLDWLHPDFFIIGGPCTSFYPYWLDTSQLAAKRYGIRFTIPRSLLRGSLFSQLNLELWPYYFGGAIHFNPKHGYGEEPAPGIGNIHSGVAARTEEYFAHNYPNVNLLPTLSHGQRLELLHRDE